MAEFTHTPECIRGSESTAKSQAEYDSRWPNHCKHCKGAGYFTSTYDPSPSGVSLGSGHMTEQDPCPECLEHGKCPRCGETNPNTGEDDYWNDWSTPCIHCGFTSQTDWGRYPDHECYCWEVQYKDMLKGERDETLPEE